MSKDPIYIEDSGDFEQVWRATGILPKETSKAKTTKLRIKKPKPTPEDARIVRTVQKAREEYLDGKDIISLLEAFALVGIPVDHPEVQKLYSDIATDSYDAEETAAWLSEHFERVEEEKEFEAFEENEAKIVNAESAHRDRVQATTEAHLNWLQQNMAGIDVQEFTGVFQGLIDDGVAGVTPAERIKSLETTKRALLEKHRVEELVQSPQGIAELARLKTRAEQEERARILGLDPFHAVGGGMLDDIIFADTNVDMNYVLEGVTKEQQELNDALGIDKDAWTTDGRHTGVPITESPVLSEFFGETKSEKPDEGLSVSIEW